MKMSKRIFVCLIALAIGVSMLALGVFADGTELKYTTENHARILEYYEEPIIFGLDFEGEEVVSTGYTHAQLVNVKSATATSPTNTTAVVANDDGKYLSITGGTSDMRSSAAFINWNAEAGTEIDDFILEFDIMTSGEGNRTVEIYVGETAATVAEIIAKNGVPGTSIVKINFADGKIEYVNGSADGAYTYGSVDAALASDTFYHVALNYSVVNCNVSFDISLGEQSVAAYTDGVIPTEVVGNIRVGASIANMKKSTVAYDNVVASGGSFARIEEDKIPETERAISDFITICQSSDVSVDEKVAVVNTGMRLITVHGVVGETDEARANVLAFKKIGVGLFVDQLVACVNGITEDAPYAELVEYVESYAKFVDLIPEDVSFMDDAAACEAAVAAYQAEVERLEALKTDSEHVLAVLADVDLSNTNIRSYSYLKSYYDAIANATPYIGYPGIPEIMESYNTVIEKYEQLDALGDMFAENVGIATDTDNTFGVRFNAFCVARDSYFDDPAYPEIESTLLAYNGVKLEMDAVIALCDEFILNVNRADYSQYLSAKQNALNSAENSLAEITEKYIEYPGVPAAIERYNELTVSVGDSIAAAESYVAFVNELAEKADTLTKEELQAEINKALELQKTGNVIGVDGVTEANISLNNMQSDLELTVGYKTQFSNLVSELLAEKDNALKYGLALDAIEAAANAERYEGVNSDDKAKLDAAVAEYNAKIQALNDGFAAANEVACNTVSASSGSSADNDCLGRVIALIKKFYE